jgi:hypothetical protein
MMLEVLAVTAAVLFIIWCMGTEWIGEPRGGSHYNPPPEDGVFPPDILPPGPPPKQYWR